MPEQQTAAASRPIGAHVPVAGGLATAGLRYAAAVGAEAIQVFVTNPRAWAPAPGVDTETAALRAHVDATGLAVFVHAPYLVNLGSPDDVLRSRSQSALDHSLRRAAAIGARGVVVHAGSAITADRPAGLDRMRQTLLPLLDALPEDGPDLLIEPMAGQGQMLCATIADLAPYLSALGWHPRARLCLDTCHLFAAGHDLTDDRGVASMLTELGQVAPGRLRLIHANDAKDPCGSARDRHQNIGKGTIGTRPFRELLHHPATASVPFVVETPGARQGQARDIATLKRLRGPPRTDGRPAASVPGR
ncbi:MAG TPA: deoxyribonuclease IV [Streptosporangiaceae bacterium]|nr:deoxyribonuclease IV [Streptosporangiaceae bacterium]